MTKSGPQRYPGADQSHRYQDTYGGDAMEVNVVVLHTTEGRTLPGYGGGGSAPNLTAVPDLAAKKLRWFQHFDIETSSRALVNKAGGVATNTLNVCQVELVGTCDPVTHAKWGTSPHVFWPEAPEWALAELAAFLRWMHEQHGVPLSGPKSWPAYPSSYGATDARFTFEEWNAFAGVCGHLHVPENTHGDPGALDFTRLLALAKGTTEEDDMPTAAEVAAEVAKTLPAAVWGHRLNSPTAAEGADPSRPAGVFLAYTDAKQKQLLSQLAELKTIEAGQSAAIAALAEALGRVDSALDVTALVTQVRTAVSEAATQAVEGLQVRIDITP